MVKFLVIYKYLFKMKSKNQQILKHLIWFLFFLSQNYFSDFSVTQHWLQTLCKKLLSLYS